jgi:3D (Asp-Asp-Asp) domain-containing protein
MIDERQEKRNFYICTILLFLVLILISYGFWSDAHGSEKKWKSQYMTVTATAYCLCKKCTGKDPHDGKTATNHNAYNAGIAVDPKVISYGSRIDCAEYIRKPTWCEADDCSESKEKGGKISGNHIDLRMTDHQSAINFGKKEVKIRVWTEE